MEDCGSKRDRGDGARSHVPRRPARAIKISVRTALAVALLALPLTLHGAIATAAVSFVVDSIGDAPDVNTADGLCADTAGQCTLRAAIQQANATPGADTIMFSIPGAAPHTIQPGSSLPTISQQLEIDGTSEPDFAGSPVVELDGSLAGSTTYGLTVNANAPGTTIRGLVVNRFGRAGIHASGSTGTIVKGNYIGIDVTGTLDRGNASEGVLLNVASNAVVGGIADADRNVVSGNDIIGVKVTGSGSIVQGNYIGTNAAGTAAIPNQHGIQLIGGGVPTSNNLIGGTSTGAGNVISGNTFQGVLINTFSADATASNTIAGNLVGTQGDGTSSLGNGQNGILVSGSTPVGANTIGSTAAGAGNVIAFNRGAGIKVDTGNVRQKVAGNRIYSNVGLGIDLGPTGVTANDIGDADSGANELQNFPVLTMAASDGVSTTVQGSLTSAIATSYRLEFFSSPSCDGSGHGEGRTFLGAVEHTSDNDGVLTFTAVLGVGTAGDEVVTATATDPNGNTSELSACVSVTAGVADMSIAKVDSADPATAGTNLTYTLTVDNLGAAVAQEVTVTDVVPEGVTFVSASASGTYDHPTRTVTWELGDFTPERAAAQLDLVVAIDAARTADLTNTGSLTSSSTDGSGANDADTETTQVTPAACSPEGPTGAVTQALPPANLRQDGLPAVAGRPAFESDECIYLFAERQDVALTQTLNPAKPKTTNILATATPEATTIPSGTVVDAYLLHADRPGQPTSGVTSLSGRWTFDQPIVGISIAHGGLTFTDPMVGLAAITYEQSETGRGVETIAQSSNFDDVHVDPADPKTVVVTFKFLQAQDEIRIFTAAPGTIVVRKDAVPDDPEDFAFTAGGGLAPGPFALDDDSGDSTLAAERRFEGIAAGSGYSVAETVPAGWTQTSATCSDGSPVTNINVAAGETVTCTFVNSKELEPCTPAPGNAVVATSPPRDLRLGATESNACIFLFDEQQDLTLAGPLTVDSSTTGSTVLPAGSRVTSYLLHHDKVGGSAAGVTLQGSYTFPERVLGFIHSISRLESTDASLGTPGSCPPSPPPSGLCYETNDAAGRGLELPADVIDVQPDGRTVSFTMGTNTGLDNVRVLVGSLPGGTIVVRKDAVPDAPDDFAFTTGGGFSPATFQLDDDPGDATLGNELRFDDVPPGSGYSVVEAVPAGWTQTSATCSDGSPVTNISLASGETVTCTFANTRQVEPCTPAPGNAIVASDPPRDLRLDRTESDTCILLFTEQQDVTLAHDINPKAPSTTSVLAAPTRRIPAGTVVDGYLLHADKVGSSAVVVRLTGTWTFDEPILGISVTRDGLLTGDAITGVPGLTYEPSEPDRGLEAAAPQSDFLRVDPSDPRTLEVDLRFAASMDEIRVFTGSIAPPEPCDAEDPANAIEQAYPPADLRINGKESDRCIYLFDEQQDVPLSQTINVKKPLTTNMLAGPNVTIAAGNEVDSFLLHADSPGAVSEATVTLSGSWRFEEPILGVSVTKDGLVTGDGLTGLPDPGSLRYEKTLSARGLEGTAGDMDSIRVDSADPNLLHLQFHFNAMDEIRVFTGVRAPAPDCIPPSPPNAVSPELPEPPPADLRLDQYESNTCIRLFDERQDVELMQDIQPKRPAATNMLAAGVRTLRIPAGSVVDSFLLHADSLGASTASSPVTLTGSVTFDEPVVGVSVTSSGLRTGDPLTGLPDPDVIRYEQASDARGLEGPGLDDDQVYVDPDDPNTLHVRFHFNAMDEIRVYTGTLFTGTIIVRKDALPDHAQDFAFSAGGGFEPETFSLDDDGDEGNALQSTASDVVYAGAGYSAAEGATPAGWSLTGMNCDDGSPVANIHVGAGETVTCTFTNTKHARIVVVKQTSPDGDPTGFDFTASYDADGFTLVDGQSNDSGVLSPATYAVAESMPVGWRQQAATCSDDSNPAAVALGVGEVVTCTFVNERIPPGRISGIKFEDEDGDGTRDFPEEAGLSGWWIRAYVDDNGDGDLDAEETTVAASIQTGTDGAYSLAVLPDSYVLCEVAQAQWEQTAPTGNACGGSAEVAAGGHALTLASAEAVVRSFGNRLRRATVSGVKFRDDDANGVQAVSGEPGLPGWDIRAYADDGDGLLEPGEGSLRGSALTEASGSYSLTLAPGTYVICEVAQAEWEQTAPAGAACGVDVTGLGAGGYSVTVGPGAAAPGNDFGNRLRRSRLAGIKFLDENGDAVQAATGEPGLADWTIRVYADADSDGVVDADEAVVSSAQSATDGSYGFTLAPGSYVVCELAQDGWEQTAPSDGSCAAVSGLAPGGHGLTLAPGQVLGARDFGNRLRRVTIAGVKFSDEDGNGVQAPSGEPPLSGWTIRVYFDADADGVLDAGEAVAAFQATGADGSFDFTLPPGRYVVCEVAQVDWEQTAPAPGGGACAAALELASGGHSVSLAPGDEAADRNFGNRLVRAAVSGTKFEDVDADGVRDLTEAGLAGWEIRAYVDDDADGVLDAGEATLGDSDVTAADGSYTLTLAPRRHVVCEVQRASWRQTAPTPAANQCGDTLPGLADTGYAVVLTPGGFVLNRDFGNNGGRLAVAKMQQDCTPTTRPCTARLPDPIEIDFGDLVRYTVTVRNDGPGTSALSAVRDEVPLDWTIVTEPTGAACAAPAPRQRRCTISPLPPGGQLEIVMEVRATLLPPPCTIVGTSGNDTIVDGSSGGNIICGLGGRDSISAGPGNDVVYGDAPANVIWPGAQVNRAWIDNDGDLTPSPGEAQATTTATLLRGGDDGDVLRGETGADTIWGQLGGDTIMGGEQADTLFGNEHDDTVFGNEHNDTIHGNEHNDTIHGGGHADTILGGLGSDTVSGDQSSGPQGKDVIHGEAGDDTINGGDDDDTITGDSGTDELGGGDGFDSLSGGTQADILAGNAGNDELLGDDGADQLFGGDGSDYLNGGDGHDRLAGDNGTSYATGTGSPDRLNGDSGNDLLIGQGGHDGWCKARSCPNRPDFSYGPDRTGPVVAELFGHVGTDRIHGGPGDDRLDGGAGHVNNILVGGTETDDFCSNGPLEGDLYAGTDRGDIRHPSCEYPATGQSERADRRGSRYFFVRVTLDIPSLFDWNAFSG